jgi:multidrug resistance efflux pump
MVVRDDALRRTVLSSPVHGFVKTMQQQHRRRRASAPGAPLMDIVPLSDTACWSSCASSPPTSAS